LFINECNNWRHKELVDDGGYYKEYHNTDRTQVASTGINNNTSGINSDEMLYMCTHTPTPTYILTLIRE